MQETERHPPISNLHTKCQQEIKSYQHQISQLKVTVTAMKDELAQVISGTISALRQCRLLDSFMNNERVTLTQAQKDQLAQQMSQDPILVQALIKLGQSRTVNGARRAQYLMKMNREQNA